MLSVLILCAVVPFGTLSASAKEGDYPQLTLDVPYSVELTEQGSKFVSFTPAADGIYAFYSTGDYDTSATLWGKNMNYLAYNDNGDEDRNFRLVYLLTANETYYLEVEVYGEDYPAEFNVACELTDLIPATGIAVEQGNAITGYTGMASIITYIPEPDNGYIEDVECTSSDDEVAEAYRVYVNSNIVNIYCYKPGTAVITLNDNFGNSTECTVTVVDPQEVEPDKIYSGDLPEKGSSAAYKFIPAETDTYLFHAVGDDRICLEIFDSEFSHIGNQTAYGGDAEIRRVLEAGETYFVKITAKSSETNGYDFTVGKVPVLTKLEVETPPDKTEYYEGFTEEDIDSSGLVLKLTWSNGEVTYWENDGDNEDKITALKGEMLFTELDEENNYCWFCGELECKIPLTVVEVPVASIELAEDTRWEYIENCGGYLTTAWNPFTGEYDDEFYFYSAKSYSTNIKVNFTDGTSETVSLYDSVLDADFRLNSDQYVNHWQAGNDYYFTVSLMGKQTRIPVTILENPVDHISVPEGSSVTRIENVSGHWTTDYMTGEEYFYYYSSDDNDDITVEIHYKNGTVVTAKVDDTIDGEYIYTDNDQYARHWTMGGENYMTVSYLGHEAQVAVNIVESPVASIEVTSAPTRVYLYGDEYYGGTEHFLPDDLTGLAFTVHFKDGTQKSYSYDKNKNRYNYFDGYELEIALVNGVQTIGQNAVSLTYMGATAEYSVTVRENNIKSAAVTKLPDNTTVDQYHYTDWIGTEITVTYTDDTTKTVKLEKDDISYGLYMGNVSAYFEIDGVTGRLFSTMSVGEGFALEYGSLRQSFGGITVVESPELTSLDVENFSPSGKNMLVKLGFSNGTSENVLCDDFAEVYYPVPDLTYILVRTEKGLLPVRIIHAYDLPTSVNVWSKRVEIVTDVLRGDVNGDGKVTIDDATLLQQYLAEYEVDDSWLVKCGDVNRDGRVDINDVTALQRFIAELENPYRIGEKS